VRPCLKATQEKERGGGGRAGGERKEKKTTRMCQRPHRERVAPIIPKSFARWFRIELSMFSSFDT
jgi:hypothetical protein